jgi:uroporphyrinogen-III synthase
LSRSQPGPPSRISVATKVAILTRPDGRNLALADRLRSAGWEAFEWPALRIEALPADASGVPLPDAFDLVVFVSGNAAALYLDQLHARGVHAWPRACAMAAMGPASAAALRASGWCDAGTTIVHPGPEAERHDSEALWEILARGVLPRRVLIVRGTQGRDWLGEQLQRHGAQVTPHAVYRRSAAEWGDAALGRLTAWAQAGVRPSWLLTSGEGIAAAQANILHAGLAQWWAGCRFIVTHPGLAQRLAADAAVAPQRVTVCVPADDAIFNAFVSA